MKKVLFISLCAALTISFTACGEGEISDSSAESYSVTKTAEESSVTSQTTVGEPEQTDIKEVLTSQSEPDNSDTTEALTEEADTTEMPFVEAESEKTDYTTDDSGNTNVESNIIGNIEIVDSPEDDDLEWGDLEFID